MIRSSTAECSEYPHVYKHGIGTCIARAFWDQVQVTCGTVLDIGCGQGDMGKAAPHGIETVGIDIDPQNLRSSSEFYQQVLQHDLNSDCLPFPDAKFNGIFAKDVLEHIHHPWKVTQEMFRVLAPGGRVLASVPMAKPKIVWNDYTHVRGFTKGALVRLFQDSGFEVCWVLPGVGYSKLSRLGLGKHFFAIMQLPFIKHIAVSHIIRARKPILK